MNVNYGTMKLKSYNDDITVVTTKGQKYKLVASLKTALASNELVVKELSKAKVLSEKDATKLAKARENIARLKNTIKEQQEMFGLKIECR